MVKDDARKVNELILKIRHEKESECAPYSLSYEEGGIKRFGPIDDEADDPSQIFDQTGDIRKHAKVNSSIP